MNFFDQLLASGYYVFDGKLHSHIVRMAITFLRKHGMTFSRDELVMKEINKYMYFDMIINHYVLREGYNISDLGDFLDVNLITLFHNLKKAWDYHHSKKIGIEEPTFESAMKNVLRDEPVFVKKIKK